MKTSTYFFMEDWKDVSLHYPELAGASIEIANSNKRKLFVIFFFPLIDIARQLEKKKICFICLGIRVYMKFTEMKCSGMVNTNPCLFLQQTLHGGIQGAPCSISLLLGQEEALAVTIKFSFIWLLAALIFCPCSLCCEFLECWGSPAWHLSFICIIKIKEGCYQEI